MDILKAEIEDTKLLQELAHKIWWESYKGILSDEQIAFMLEDIYSEASIRRQMEDGAVFIIIREEVELSGFASYGLKDSGILRIHKLYFFKTAQGKGLGKMVLTHIESAAQSHNVNTIELNVNRNNPAYYFYLKQGFTVMEEVDIPYYRFVLNDYVMQKAL
jgi:diamine N-acetyltransferase